MKKIKQILACFLAAAIFIPVGSVSISGEKKADSDTEASSETDTSADDSVTEDEEYINRTKKEVLSSMTLACENKNLKLYYSEEEDMLALVNKSNGCIWWSSPINAGGDPLAKGLVKKELQSSVVLLYGQPANRTTGTLRSSKNGKMIYKPTDNGLKITYKFPMAGFTIPIEYTLEESCLSARINTSEIKEEKTDGSDGKILIDISVLPNITAADDTQQGYYIIPDGSGAIINFNNGKINAKSYTGKIYGDDITSVPLIKSSVTKQLFLPLYGSVMDDGNGLLSVIHKGDENAQILANVSELSKSSYNTCSAKFNLRSTDTYYMSGEPLTVFEKGKIKAPALEMKYYPLYEKKLGYADIAAAYRQYLINEQGVQKKETGTSLYVDIYGGAEKKEPFLGIPVTKKKGITTFSQAEEILNLLVDGGADSIILGLDNWTDDGIKNKVDCKTKPASVLGGKKDFDSLKGFCENNDISFYPGVNNKTFSTGNGYWEFKDTALRTSGQYSKQMSYNLAYGTENQLKDTQSLLSPANFPKIFSELSESYSKAGLSGVCIGDQTSVLYGDYGKKSLSRSDSVRYIEEGLEKINEKVGSVLAKTANAYTLKYIDRISCVPLESSDFDIFDMDIPFYQMVMHGLIPYSTTSVNGSADSERLFLMAVATGSDLHYDMVYEDASELKDTEYDIYYYANYYYWTDTITGEYRLIKDVLGGLKDYYITDYRQTDTGTVTGFSDGTELKVNFENGEIELNGSVYRLTDYIDSEGGLIF